MNGLGVGGSNKPDLINRANAVLYCCNMVCCALGPWLTYAIGFRNTLIFGALGYPFYAAGLYTGATWLIYLGSVTTGVTGGFLWCVEGAIATGYPEARKRGRYIATWFTFRNMGNLVGGAISLGMNAHATKPGKVGQSTYIVFIVIQCLPGFIAMLLSNPHQVRRDDGTRVQSPKPSKWSVEARELWRLVSSRNMLFLTPMFFYLGWIQAYPGTFLATYFTVRSRALGSFMSAVVTTFSTWLAGLLVDLAWVKKRQTRAVTMFGLICVMNTATWCWAVPIQNEYRHTHPVLDWSMSRFGRGFGIYMFERISYALVENYTYWCISNLSDAPGDQIRYSSFLRGVESAATAIAFGIQSIPAPLIVTAAINMGLWFVVLPFSGFATIRVVRKFNSLERRQQPNKGIEVGGPSP